MKKKIALPRAPLPRQTEKVVPAQRGGKYDRKQFRREARAEFDSARAEFDSARREIQEG